MTPLEGTMRFFESVARTPVIMGILNVTPDSFYDGGRHNNIEMAVEKAARMTAEGAAIIDVGGESTRPGFTPVSPQEEIDRTAPVIEAISRRIDIPLSIDTTKAVVADAALAAGAHLLNDVWGLKADAEMAAVTARHRAGAILMHNRTERDEGVDIMSDINDFFSSSLALALAAGIPRAHIMLDPGIGFGKTREQNLQVIADLGRLHIHGLPILMGLSRKSFIGLTINDMNADRLPGTIAANLAAIANGARVLRVHDVAAHAQALRIWHETYKAHP